MRTAVGADSGLGKSLKFDLKGDGVIHIDGGEVTNEDKPADLTMTISRDNLTALGAGKLDRHDRRDDRQAQAVRHGRSHGLAAQAAGAVLPAGLTAV